MADEKNKKKVVYGRDIVDDSMHKSAIALEYNPDEEAPKVIASGRGHLADKIIDKAQEYDIPVHQDKKLANSLSNLEIGEYIPKELYQVVLVYVDAMDRIKGRMDQKGEDGWKKKK